MGLLLVLLAVLASAQPSHRPPNGGDVAELVTSIRLAGDRVEPERIDELAAHRSAEALAALADLFEDMRTAIVREAIVRAVGSMRDHPELGARALRHLERIARSSKATSVFSAAIEEIEAAGSDAEEFLRRIVTSPAEDAVRELALERHLSFEPDEEDLAWYRRVFETGGAAAGEGDEPGAPLAALRDLAFAALATRLDVAQLEEEATTKRRDGTTPPRAGIRRAALRELVVRDSKKAAAVAEETYGDVTENPENRALAARVLFEIRGDKILNSFVDDGRKRSTPPFLRNGLADLLNEVGDDGVMRKLVKRVGKGKAGEDLFLLRALRGVRDERLTKALTKLVLSDEAEVAVRAVEHLAAQDDEETGATLREALEEAAEPAVAAALISALGAREPGGDDPGDEWSTVLLTFATDVREDVRCAALAQLGRAHSGPGGSGGAEILDPLVAALGDTSWSIRLCALRALEDLRTPECVGAIIERMSSEDGRIRHELADALERLTGQQFRTASTWARWWKDHAATFQPLTEEEYAELSAARAARRDRWTTRAGSASDGSDPEFFGVRILSHNVLFILDISGSMNDPMRSGDIRIDIALRQMEGCIDALPPGSRFNIIAFSSGVSRWSEDGAAESDEASREDAKEWVGRLGALGGTDLHGALRQGFRDKDFDTIYILSDGEPAGGEISDPWEIREVVRRWNEHRRVILNTIALGSRLQILRWLAEDSGGTYTQIR